MNWQTIRLHTLFDWLVVFTWRKWNANQLFHQCDLSIVMKWHKMCTLLACAGRTLLQSDVVCKFLAVTYWAYECISYRNIKGSSDLLWSRVVRRLSSVVCCLSTVRQFTFSNSSPERLYGFWWNEILYAWSTQGPLQVLLFFGQIRPGADPGLDQNRSRDVPFFKELLLQTGRLQQQTEYIGMI